MVELPRNMKYASSNELRYLFLHSMSTRLPLQVGYYFRNAKMTYIFEGASLSCQLHSFTSRNVDLFQHVEKPILEMVVRLVVTLFGSLTCKHRHIFKVAIFYTLFLVCIMCETIHVHEIVLRFIN